MNGTRITNMIYQNSIDRLLGSINRIFQAIPHEFCHSSLINLQNTKTQKLTKASENNMAGLTYVNQRVQIDNIWHSSLGVKPIDSLCDGLAVCAV